MRLPRHFVPRNDDSEFEGEDEGESTK